MTKTYARHLTGDERATTRAKAAALYAQGCTIRSVAAELGRSYGNTRDLLLEAKVPMRAKGGGIRKAAA